MENELKEDKKLKTSEPYKYWQQEISRAKKFYKPFFEKAEKTARVYSDNRLEKEASSSKFNILWSNVDTLRSAIYGRPGTPDVSKRYQDVRNPQQNAIGNTVAKIIERSLKYCSDVYESKTPLQLAVLDSLVVGRGVARVKYEPVITKVRDSSVSIDEATGGIVASVQEREVIADQKLYIEFINWENFLTEPASKWEDVRWVAFSQQYTYDELKSFFGQEVADKIPLNHAVIKEDDRPNEEVDKDFKRAIIWEIWDKSDRKRIYFAEGDDKIIKIDDDPYNLEHFFPLPKPIYGAVISTDTILPKPDYCIYQDQAEELNFITARITNLINALKRRGIYDASFSDLSRLADAQDNVFVPVQNFQYLNGSGLSAVMTTEDLTPISNVLTGLYNQRNVIIQSIYEITGISDVIRGSTNPNETATAQRIKGQFGSMRLRARQDDVQRFVKDLFRIQAEIIAEHFEPEILANMSGTSVEEVSQVIDILRDDKLRSYSVDVETDSTIFDDDAQNKTQTIEMIGALTGFMKEFLPAINDNPAIAPVAKGIMRLGLGAFKKGREIEQLMEQAFSQLAQPKPNTDAIMEQQKLEAQKIKDRADIAIKEQGNNIKKAQVMLDAKKIQNQQMNAVADMAFQEKQANQGTMGEY